MNFYNFDKLWPLLQLERDILFCGVSSQTLTWKIVDPIDAFYFTMAYCILHASNACDNEKVPTQPPKAWQPNGNGLVMRMQHGHNLCIAIDFALQMLLPSVR